MPTFDVVSELDMHEVSNAVDQANREMANRFDFKGVKASFEQTESVVMVRAEVEFQLTQMLDILRSKLTSRKIDIACMEMKDPETNLAEARQEITLRQGLDQALSKKLVKLIKTSKLKVQAQIQGDKLRIQGKKRDDLQSAIAFLKSADVEMPLQYINFRD